MQMDLSLNSQIARSLMDGLKEGVALFDGDGCLVFANAAALSTVAESGAAPASNGRALMSALRDQGARVAHIDLAPGRAGQVVYLPAPASPATLAANEKQAILDRLEATDWKLAETARQLGISRTTLWRRLKEYRVRRDGRGW